MIIRTAKIDIIRFIGCTGTSEQQGLNLEHRQPPDFFNILDPDGSFKKIVMVNPFAFRERQALADHLDHPDRRSAPGVFFTMSFADTDRLGLQAVMDHLTQWLAQKPGSMTFGVTACLDAPGNIFDGTCLGNWKENGLKLIHWQCPAGMKGVPDQMLWQLSKKGIWNHVSMVETNDRTRDRRLEKFILDNPHIVQSFVMAQNRAPLFSTYDKVAQLPGCPAWMRVKHPADLLACLNRFSMDQFIMLRCHDSRVITLGRAVRYHYRPPSDLPPGYLDRVCAMVAAGGSVDLTHVRTNLENAYLIGYAQENGVVVGNSSLKHPRTALIQRLKTATGLDFSGFVERGYTSVRPEYRSLGVGRKLLEGLTARAGKYKVFSIIDEDNLATQTIARRNNTRKIATYFSEKTNKHMGIWMPSHMMPGPEKELG